MAVLDYVFFLMHDPCHVGPCALKPITKISDSVIRNIVSLTVWYIFAAFIQIVSSVSIGKNKLLTNIHIVC